MRYREIVPAMLTIILLSMVAGYWVKAGAARNHSPQGERCVIKHKPSDGLTLVVCKVASEDMATYDYHNGKAYFYVYRCNAVDDRVKTGDC
jgi:hypothetical protein